MAELAPGRRRTALATLAWSVAMVAVAIGLLAWWRSGFDPTGFVFMTSPAPMAALAAMVTAQASIGLLLTVRMPGNAAGWLIAAFSVVTGIAFLTIGLVAASYESNPVLASWLAWAGSWLCFPTGIALASGIALVFPDGRLLSSRWWDVTALLVVGMVLTAGGMAVAPGRLPLFPGLENPAVREMAGGWALGMLRMSGLVMVAAGSAAGAVALVVRVRCADAAQRQQLYWYMLAVVALVLAFSGFLVAAFTLPPDAPLGETVLTVAWVLTCAPPLVILHSIRRYRLYEIDRILGRAFVYGAMTAFVAGVYTASIRLFRWGFTSLTGEGSDLALVITTLLLATTFTPIKRALESAVERSFADKEKAAESPVHDLLGSAELAALIDAHIVARLGARGATQDPSIAGVTLAPNETTDPPLAT